MLYDSLLKQGKIKVYKASITEITQLQNISMRDLQAAVRILDTDPEWAYSMAYNAILQSCRALMLSEGYRPRGSDQDATVVAFTRERLGEPFEPKVQLFDQMRRKRHRIMYDLTGLIGKKEAEQAISFAKEFVEDIRQIISRQPKLTI